MSSMNIKMRQKETSCGIMLESVFFITLTYPDILCTSWFFPVETILVVDATFEK
jgi:hypothetical protein